MSDELEKIDPLYPSACLRIVDKTNTHRTRVLIYGIPPRRIDIEEACRDFIAAKGLAEKEPVGVVKWRIDYHDTTRRPEEGYVASSRRRAIENEKEPAETAKQEEKATAATYDDGI